MDNISIYAESLTANRKKLFEQAFICARHGKVLYILNEELSELPELSQKKQYMKMISFLYVKTSKTLIESLSTLPDWHNIPSTLILDDLNSFSGDSIQAACGIVAYLIDTVQSCSIALQSPLALFVSISNENVTEEYCKVLKELYCARNILSNN